MYGNIPVHILNSIPCKTINEIGLAVGSGGRWGRGGAETINIAHFPSYNKSRF